MKKITTVLLSCLMVSQVMAQSSIVSFSVDPPNPTTTDEITIYTELVFPSSGCFLDFQNHSLVNNTFSASVHHCLGLALAICNTTDTFEIGILPEGSYTFDLTLSSGYGDPGCSPGIVPDDNDSVSFVVTSGVGIHEHTFDQNGFFPNPVTDKLIFKKPTTEPSFLYNLSGELIIEIDTGSEEIDLSELSPGTYVLKRNSINYRVVKL